MLKWTGTIKGCPGQRCAPWAAVLNSRPALESLIEALPTWVRVERPGPITRVPLRLEERLGRAVLEELVAAYRAGDSTRTLALRHGVGITAINRLLRRQGVTVRARGGRHR
jgi:hypothetical protein